MIHRYGCYPKKNSQAVTSCILYIQENHLAWAGLAKWWHAST